jgi:hypothetical protein
MATSQSADCGFVVGLVGYEPMADSYTRLVSLLAAVAALSSCSQFIGTCTWVVPEANPALKVVEARKPIGSECNCINCGAPGRFLIERDSYTLEFWNGDRWYAELYVRARGKDGAILALSSEPPELLRMAPHVPEIATHGFEYFMRVDPQEGKDYARSLSISVTHPDGQVLGVEAIRLRGEYRKDVSFELEM